MIVMMISEELFSQGFNFYSTQKIGLLGLSTKAPIMPILALKFGCFIA
jgi:hypothetical protein